jgi:hypothetical protein
LALWSPSYLFVYGTQSGQQFSSVSYKFSTNMFGMTTGPLVGQNNPAPYATFYNHVLLKIGKDYYDPSYGRKYKDPLDMQKQSIAGFFKMVVPRGANGYTMSIRKAPAALLLAESKDASQLP